LQILIFSDLHARQRAVAVRKLGLNPHDLQIEVADAFRRPDRHAGGQIADVDASVRGVRQLIREAALGTCPVDGVTEGTGERCERADRRRRRRSALRLGGAVVPLGVPGCCAGESYDNQDRCEEQRQLLQEVLDV